MSVAIIIPTYNGNQFLIPCVESVLKSTDKNVHVYIVNNGDAGNMVGIADPRLTVLQQESNRGWEGGLIAGLADSREEFVVFLNDDTFIPPVSVDWIGRMRTFFDDLKVAAVGPSSNCVMGAQQIFIPINPNQLRVSFLIGFCMMVRRSALEEVGGVDDELPGGDDLDLSIRFRKAGYVLVADRKSFVYHHGFKTGERVNGGPNQAGGWNSLEMTEKTNFALMRKHGLRAWMETMNNQILGTYGLQ